MNLEEIKEQIEIYGNPELSPEDMEWLIAEVERLREELSRTWEGMWKARAEKLEAELEAERTFRLEVAGRKEKAEAEVERLEKRCEKTLSAFNKAIADLSTCQERVRELTAERNGLKRELDAWARVQTKEGGE